MKIPKNRTALLKKLKPDSRAAKENGSVSAFLRFGLSPYRVVTGGKISRSVCRSGVVGSFW